MTTVSPEGVRVHLHFAMTGRSPLRLLDLLFCDARVLAVEYDYVTPVDLLLGRPGRRAETFARTVTDEGMAAAVEAADRVGEFRYAELSTVRVHDGGRFGRPKVTLHRPDGPALAVRVHGEIDTDAFTEALETALSGTGTAVERARDAGLGLADRLLGPVSR